MNAMIVYDSAYGNTAQVAEAMAEALRPLGEVNVLRADEVEPTKLAGPSLLIVGSPTQRFRPLPAVTDLLKRIPTDGLRGVKVAAFDTRLTEAAINKIRILAFFVRIFGYAAKPIASRLEKAGGELAVAPEGFYVADSEGPLLEGELQRAAAWAVSISETTE